MSPDVLAQLHAADPCPDAGYDESVAQRNIDTIVRTDLTVRSGVPVRPRRRRGWVAVAAVAVVVAVAGSVVGVEIARDDATPSGSDGPWETFSENGVSFEHPVAWRSYPPGPASTMSSTLAYLSTQPFGPVCTTTTDGVNESMVCHGPQPDLHGGGVMIDWSSGSMPGSGSLEGYPGDPTTLAGAEARVDRSDVPSECIPTRAAAGIQAAITAPRNGLLIMIACVGPGDVEAGLAAVDRMLASVRIER